jgi:preprotein translocase subunit SecD
MNRRYVNLALILFLLIVSIFVDSGSTIPILNKSLPTVLGLDLRGGTQALLEVDLPATTAVTSQQMGDARQILEGRINGLGVSEAVVQVAGERRMVVEIPGLTNPDEVISIIKETGLLEFVDLGTTQLPVGTTIVTDFSSGSSSSPTPTASPEATATAEPTPGPGTPTAAPTASPTPETIWHTVLTGDQLSSVTVGTSSLGAYEINFTLKSGPDGADKFAAFTRDNIGKILAIVLDKKIISAPSINGEIPNGSGQITGSFTYDEANNLAIQMRYGSLPVPLKVVESRVIGPTLGKDSLDKSILAGIIGFLIVTLFMIIYYRLPGILAMLSILTYALITLALFKIIPVTLTLPGIAGFLLSTGGALDANILIFERMKEELRSGRPLGHAIDLGWRRAWPSIRDSNFATLITSVILYWFGSSFGATIVKGFAVTLFLGVLISLFCAIVVTRTFLSLTLNFLENPSERLSWFGL